MKPSPAAESSTLEALYRGYHGWLLGWLRRRVQCSHHASDLAQDTFIRLLAAGPYVAPREPRAFLATVARRLLIDNGRRLRLSWRFARSLNAALPTSIKRRRRSRSSRPSRSSKPSTGHWPG